MGFYFTTNHRAQPLAEPVEALLQSRSSVQPVRWLCETSGWSSGIYIAQPRKPSFSRYQAERLRFRQGIAAYKRIDDEWARGELKAQWEGHLWHAPSDAYTHFFIDRDGYIHSQDSGFANCKILSDGTVVGDLESTLLIEVARKLALEAAA